MMTDQTVGFMRFEIAEGRVVDTKTKSEQPSIYIVTPRRSELISERNALDAVYQWAEERRSTSEENR